MTQPKLPSMLLLGLLVAGSKAQQPPATASPSFEVASIRPSHMTPGCYSELPPGGPSYALTCVSLRYLIMLAYKTSHLQGADKTLDTYYDLHATTSGGKPWTKETLRPMMQQFLAERFHLQVHPGKMDLSGYGLVVSKGGSKLKSAAPDTVVLGQKAGAPSANFIYAGHIQGRGLDAEGVAGLLGAGAHAQVVNHTGLSGLFNLDLSYATDDGTNPQLPSFFTAVEEQLGLRLISEKITVDTVVIDHVDEAPTAN